MADFPSVDKKDARRNPLYRGFLRASNKIKLLLLTVIELWHVSSHTTLYFHKKRVFYHYHPIHSFTYKDTKIIATKNHHTTREAILAIIADDCLMQLNIIRTSLSIGTRMRVPLANVSKII